ncbi:MAG TPA: hypothetical protein VEA41_02970 [Salinarimonas sp.]|nr:hypothetical protein [Salinarimonas sp.]
MSKRAHPPEGSKSAEEIFLAVGHALSWWEAAEDAMMDLFHRLRGDQEPLAFETYVASPRAIRGRMLKSALGTCGSRLTAEEVARVRSAMVALDKLAPTRNEIAHGHCSNWTSQEDGVVVMSGFYLLPALSEGGWMRRSFRYAHTAASINAFTERVRNHRWSIVEVGITLLQRDNEAYDRLPPGANHAAQLILAVGRGHLTVLDAAMNLRHVHVGADAPTADDGSAEP